MEAMGGVRQARDLTLRAAKGGCVAAVALVFGVAAAVGQSAGDQAKISRLGPDGFAALPPLKTLVEWSDAALIGRIVGADGLTIRELEVPKSTKTSPRGYAGYRIGIDDVLFTRNPINTDSLSQGSEIAVGMEVGRESAEKFVARQIPVRNDDTCLIFLVARPHGWTLLQWHALFRRTSGNRPAAENLGGAPFAAIAASAEWRGASVTLADTPQGAAPDWQSLVAEVRRLGAKPAPSRSR